MHRVRSELQAQQMETLVESLTQKCFAKCIIKPSATMTSAQQQCVAKAMDRYLDVMNIVFGTVAKKAQQQ